MPVLEVWRLRARGDVPILLLTRTTVPGSSHSVNRGGSTSTNRLGCCSNAAPGSAASSGAPLGVLPGRACAMDIAPYLNFHVRAHAQAIAMRRAQTIAMRDGGLSPELQLVELGVAAAL